MGTQLSPLRKGSGARAEPPIFGHVYLGQTIVCIRIPLGAEVGLSLGDIVLDGDPAPEFSTNVRCGQTNRWTKMPLGMEVGLGPRDFVFDSDGH